MIAQAGEIVERKYSELVEQTILDIYFPIRTFILNNVTHKKYHGEPGEYEKGSAHAFYFPKTETNLVPDYDVEVEESIEKTFEVFYPLGVWIKIEEIQDDEKSIDLRVNIPFSNGKKLVAYFISQKGNPKRFVLDCFDYGPNDGPDEFFVSYNDSPALLNHQQFGEGERIITSGGYEATMNTIKEIKEQIQIFNDFVRRTEIEQAIGISDIQDGNEVAQGSDHTEDYDKPRLR